VVLLGSVLGRREKTKRENENQDPMPKSRRRGKKKRERNAFKRKGALGEASREGSKGKRGTRQRSKKTESPQLQGERRRSCQTHAGFVEKNAEADAEARTDINLLRAQGGGGRTGV